VPYSELQDMKEIGSGAYGIVYKAEWRNLTVAVKQIKAEHVTQKQLNEFMSEMSILRRLRAHPNVVLFMGVTFPPDPLSMITEFCGGGSLLGNLCLMFACISISLSIVMITNRLYVIERGRTGYEE